MKRLHSLLLTLALAAGLGIGLPAGAVAGDDGRRGDNSAVAVNKTDGRAVFRFAFDIARESGDVVDNENTAVAYASCEDCRTTAIAIQIVLVSSKPSTVTPENLAVALNDQCTRCQTFASAHQFVKGTDGRMTFSEEGRRELRAVRHEVKALKHENLTPAELDARLEPLVERVRTVVNSQLVPAGGDDEEDDGDGEDRELRSEERPATASSVQDVG